MLVKIQLEKKEALGRFDELLGYRDGGFVLYSWGIEKPIIRKISILEAWRLYQKGGWI